MSFDYELIVERLPPKYESIMIEYIKSHNCSLIPYLDDIFKQLYPMAIVKSKIIVKKYSRMINPFTGEYIKGYERKMFKVKIIWPFGHIKWSSYYEDDYDEHFLDIYEMLAIAEEYHVYGLIIHELLLGNGFTQDYYDHYNNADNSISVDMFHRKINSTCYKSLEDVINELKIMLKVNELSKILSRVQ